MVDDPLKKLGDTFKKARLQSGVSLEDLADKSRISINYIDSIEKGDRSSLPEEAYLMGFLNKLAKLLKLRDPQAVIDEYKAGEGQFIVQNILNENHVKESPSPFNFSFFKIYHLYILIALLVVFGIFYLFNSSPKETKSKEIIKISELKEPVEKHVDKVEIKDKDELIIPAPKKEAQRPSYETNEDSSEYGSGSKKLKINIREVTWFQVYGIAAGKVLFEGDAYPNVKPNQFEFRDDIGFALASGNAGAFEIKDSGKKFILGKSGQLIKWYYPEGARYEYKQRVKN
jgi:transcriptional regulator with XRE-family HTH domain